MLTDQLGALTRTAPRGALDPVRVFFRDGALRLQFRDGSGNEYVLVLPDGAQAGWILGAGGSAVPVPGMRWPLRFDTAQPCAGHGMFADCQHLGTGVYAGRNAVRCAGATGCPIPPAPD